MTFFPGPDNFIDIHSHNPGNEDGVFRIYNVFSSVPAEISKPRPVSIGLHPWHLSAEAIEEMPGIIRSAKMLENFIAIGEAGLDKVIKTPFEIQLDAFVKQIELSIELHKPLIIHCVRAIPELIRLRKKYSGAPGWIIHGFTAGAGHALEAVREGIYISIGQRLLKDPRKSAEILKNVPVSMIFAETDDDPASIADIYGIIAGTYGISVNELKEKIYLNFHRVFGKQ
jgi:TatD DNase family protein